MPRIALAVTAVAWLVTVVPLEWRSVLAADTIDNWIGIEYLEGAAQPDFNLLTDGFLPGVRATYTILQGVLFFRPDAPRFNFGLVQAIHFFWLLLSGVAIGRLAARLIAPRTAPLAAAMFWFAPFTLLIPLSGSPFFLGPLFTVALLWLLVSVHFERSPAALAALGPTAGYALTIPSLLPLAVVVLAAALWSAWRKPRAPALVLVVLSLSLLAAAAPALPDLGAVRDMFSRYALLRGDSALLEQVVLGQRSPMDVRTFWQAGHSAPLDLPIASLLSPFAITRTPIRLWGDVLFEPFGTALAACGIAVCLRLALRRRLAAALLVLLACGIVPGFVSSADQPSHTRMFVAPVALALLSAVGFQALTCGIPRHFVPRLATAATAAISTGGLLLFFVVNPTILAASAMGILLRALPANAPPPKAAVLDYAPGEFTWLHVERTAKHLAAHPVPVLALAPFDGPARFRGTSEDVLLWSPGLEADRQVIDSLCSAWPDSTLFRLEDRAGLSHAYAGRRAGSNWQPALAPLQWTAKSCANHQVGAPPSNGSLQ